MEAVIATGGKQYRVAPGQVIKVERLGVAKGGSVEFDKVLLLNKDGAGDGGADGVVRRQGDRRGARPSARAPRCSSSSSSAARTTGGIAVIARR